MAALIRPTEATYTINEKMTVNTSDREDHTFCGVMFPVECKEVLPVERLVITSLSVRGRLGPLSVYVSKDPDEEASAQQQQPAGNAATAASICAKKCKNSSSSSSSSSRPYRVTTKKKNRITADASQWVKIYEKTHPPSFSTYSKLDLSASPIVLRPGQVRGIYVHSTLPGDEAIVYDNYFGRSSHMGGRDTDEIPEDSFLVIKPAMAHVSETPFGVTPIWGWGDAWRRDRKFVGRLDYGVVYKLWNPKQHVAFGDKFQKLVVTLFACQRNFASPLSRLPDDCIYYILNMCKWDWVGDDTKGMQNILKARKARLKQNNNTTTEDSAMSEAENVEDEIEDSKPSGNQQNFDLDVNDEDFDEDDEEWEEEEDDDYAEDYRHSDHEGAGAILYDDFDAEEAERQEQRHNRSQLLRSYFSRTTERHLPLEDFISAVGAVMMQVDPDDGDADDINRNEDDGDDDASTGSHDSESN